MNMTITQTVEIPVDRRLIIEIPREVTADRAYVTVHFPVSGEIQPEAVSEPKTVSKKINMTRKELDEFLKNAHTPITDSLLGILKTDMTVDEIRMLRK